MAALIHAREPSIIERVEDAIVLSLKDGLSGTVKVEPFPADPKTYNFQADAACLVHFSGGRFSPPNGPVNSNQPRSFEFALVLLARSLRGQGGAYQHLEDIRLAVQGRAFAGVGPAAITRQALDDEKDGVWRFLTSITLSAIAVNRVYQQPAALMRPQLSE